MSILYRNKQEAAAADYFDSLYKQYGGIPINHQMAIDLRMQFFTKYVLDRRINDFKTPVEKDWMYVARREYFYDVNVRAASDAGFNVTVHAAACATKDLEFAGRVTSAADVQTAFLSALDGSFANVI